MKLVEKQATQKNNDLSVIFLGVGIFPFRVAGDKNFFLDLRNYLAQKGIQTHVLSISEFPAGMPDSETVTYIPRVFHLFPAQFYYQDESGNSIAYHHKHGTIRDFLEIALTLVINIFKIRKVIHAFPNPIIHWSDMSLLVPVIRLVCGRVPIVCSYLRYEKRHVILDRIRSYSLNIADVVITSTQASKVFLGKGGSDTSKIFVSPWGITGVLLNDTKDIIYRENIAVVRLLWAGYIQQIREEDFVKTVELAKKVLSKREDIEFHFSLKPESYREEFDRLQQPGLKIFKGTKKFKEELVNYDAFLSPVVKHASTMAPPLTWLEALSAGLPVITTKTLGIDELLSDHKSGLVFSTYDELKIWLINEPNVGIILKDMKQGAQSEFQEKYEINTVGEKYVRIYRSVGRK